MIVCFAASTRAAFFWAWLPHNTNTTFRGSEFTAAIAASVKVSQPLPLWLFGTPARTVNTALSISTPCCAQLSKKPCDAGGMPRSDSSSR